MHTDVDSGSPDTASNHASTRETLLERWKGNERRSKGMGGREQALQLLDLPIDILNEIIKEVRTEQQQLSIPREHLVLK